MNGIDILKYMNYINSRPEEDILEDGIPGVSVELAEHVCRGLWILHWDDGSIMSAIVYSDDNNEEFVKHLKPRSLSEQMSVRHLGELYGKSYFCAFVPEGEPDIFGTPDVSKRVEVYDTHLRPLSNSMFNRASSLDEVEDMFCSMPGFGRIETLDEYAAEEIRFICPGYYAMSIYDGTIELCNKDGIVITPLSSLIFGYELEYLGEHKGNPCFAYRGQEDGMSENNVVGAFDVIGEEAVELMHLDFLEGQSFKDVCEMFRKKLFSGESQSKSKALQLYEGFEKAVKVMDVKSKSLGK